MPQSLANVLVHLIFSTKNRVPLIMPELDADLHRYLGGICASLKCRPHQIGGTSDHVHIVCNLHRVASISELVKELKLGSGRWLKDRGVRGFSWQNGFGAFSLGEQERERVMEYVANQRDHHRKRSFQEEFILFLERYRVDYDERYVWD